MIYTVNDAINKLKEIVEEKPEIGKAILKIAVLDDFDELVMSSNLLIDKNLCEKGYNCTYFLMCDEYSTVYEDFGIKKKN